METEVLGAPIADSKKDEYTSEHRKFALRGLDGTFDKANQAFARWNISSKRLKTSFLSSISDETEVKDEGAEEPDGRRPGCRSRDKDKVSTSNAKSLKLEVLETNLPPLQIKDWYRKWENYQLASGWRQGDNHRTQLA